MAFTAEEKLSICKILGVNSIELGVQLATYSEHITSDVESAVNNELDRWTAGAGSKFVRVKPFGQNEGTDFDPEDEKRDIKKNIGLFLFFPESVWGSGLDSFQIHRG